MQPGLDPADVVVAMPSVISPQVDDRSGPDGGRVHIMSSGLAPLRAVAGDAEVAEAVVNGEDLAGEEHQARQRA